MSTSQKADRKLAALKAAAGHLRSARVDWSASLTFGRLAEITGIDQAQIARDFGSKDALIGELAKFLMSREYLPDYVGQLSDFLIEAPTSGTNLKEVLAVWAAANAKANNQEWLADMQRAEWTMWAARGPGSPEWEALTDYYATDHEAQVEQVEQFAAWARVSGAADRNELSVADAVLAVNCFILGQAYLRSLVPHLFADDLLTRVTQAVVSGFLGPDATGPGQQLEQVKLVDLGEPANEDVWAGPDVGV